MTIATRAAFDAHRAACRACTVCAEEGIIAEAHPTFSGAWGARILLVGQAPGQVERESRRPFSGRAGRELDRWMVRAGFADADEFRRLTYIARFLGPGSLDDRVGKSFGEAPVLVPLPHPSGQSRWLNDAANRERLARALALISEWRVRIGGR